MKPFIIHAPLVLVLLVGGCADLGETSPTGAADVGAGPNADGQADATATDSGAPDTLVACDGTAPQCAQAAEQRAAERLNEILEDPAALDAFLTAVPKGGDLHMHLSGSVYAETYLQWAHEEGGYCITKYSLALSTKCSDSSKSDPLPDPGDELFDEVVAAWSMQDFVAGKQNACGRREELIKLNTGHKVLDNRNRNPIDQS